MVASYLHRKILVRERVQISASGHPDADQLGTDFFRFHWMSDPILSVPNEMESAMGLNSLSGQLTNVIKNNRQLKQPVTKAKARMLFFDAQTR